MDFGPVKTPWEGRVASIVDWSGIAISASGLLYWLVTGAAGDTVLVLVFAGLLLPYAFCKPLKRRAVRKQAEALASLEFRVCPYCYYDLRGSASSGTCPECNVDFDPKSLERQWRSMMQFAKRL